MKNILVKFLIWRIWLFVPIYAALLFVPFRENFLFTTIWEYVEKYPIIQHPFVYPWSNFDGVHYLAIASKGYFTEGRFFPLFPLLIRLLSTPFTLIWSLKPYGHLVFWSGLFLSNLFFVLSLFFLRKLLLLDYKENFSNKVILALMVFPTSFFFVSIYTESLFLLLSILVLYFARKKQWYKAISCSMLLSVTRLPGVLILIPLLYEFLIYEIGITTKSWSFFKKIFSWKLIIMQLIKLSKFLIIPLPLLFYSGFNYYKWSDPLFFVNAHASLGNGREVSSIVFPLITIYRYFKIFFTVSMQQYEFWVAIIEFFALVFAIFSIWFIFKMKVRISYLLFTIVFILLPFFSGTLTGFPRYLLLAFPIFIGIVAKVGESKLYWRTFIFFNLVLQFLFLMFFSRGWFIA